MSYARDEAVQMIGVEENQRGGGNRTNHWYPELSVQFLGWRDEVSSRCIEGRASVKAERMRVVVGNVRYMQLLV